MMATKRIGSGWNPPSKERAKLPFLEPKLTDRSDHHPPANTQPASAPGISGARSTGLGSAAQPRSPRVVPGVDGLHRQPPTIEQILELDDDEQQISALWRLSHQRLLRRAVAQGVPLDAAEDVVQDVFSRLAVQLPQVRSPKIGGWLAKMVDYECKRHFSTQKRARGNQRKVQARADLHLAQSRPTNPELALIRRRELDAAVGLLAKLKPLDAYIVKSATVDGVQTAVVLEVIERRFGVRLSPRALYERRRRIRRKLAERLAFGRSRGGDGGTHD